MSITYYRVDLEHPGIAAARLPGASFDVVEVGVSAHYPGEIVFKIVEPAGKVGGQVTLGGDDPEGRLASLAMQMIEWLREMRPHHECHDMLEGLLGIVPPTTSSEDDGED